MTNIAGNGCQRLIPSSDRKPIQDIERSIITKYRKSIWSKFMKAIKEFNLIAEGDKIAVAVSGGKDSLLMAKLFQELQRHGKFKIELEFIAMNPGYHESIKQLLIENCEYLNIPVHIYESGIFEVIDRIAQDYPCYMCAKMRRGSLYAKAQELGCNKLALGHHFNDVIETTMLNLLYTGCFKTMLPKLKSTNFENIELIRPMVYVEEQYIERYTSGSGIWPLNCACMVSAGKTANKRFEIKDMIKEWKKTIDTVDMNIFRAAQNVNMESILGWQKGGKSYSYLDFYNDEED